MSVYTKIEREELEAFLTHYAVGQLLEFQGISDGIENTNYFVTTTGGRWVLTLFETIAQDELPFFLSLMAHLDAHGIPSPAPVADNNGDFLRLFKGKPAALVQRLSGKHVKTPNITQCAAMGGVLARLHVAATSFSRNRANPRGPHWWHQTAHSLLTRLAPEDAELLHDELAYQDSFRHLQLPRGIIHGDLFHDNALFQGDRLSGVIDFYYACDDVLLFDVAIAINDWCSHPDGSLDEAKAHAVLHAYDQGRKIAPQETQVWVPLLRAAALRFWLSRLYDQHFPRPGEITHIKDPQVFRRILWQRIHHPPTFIELAR
jgi:homoserine kinase type II